MSFFNFLAGMEKYAGNVNSISRMNARHKFLIEPFITEIKDARVLDIASHDGRWAYAFAAAGAKQVVGVEVRQSLIDQFSAYPDADLRSLVDLRCNDMFVELESELKKHQTYDVIGVFGIFYHTMEHFRLLNLLRQLEPAVIIIDGLFIDRGWPMIQMQRESTNKILHANQQYEHQNQTMVGVPSFAAVDAMADVLGFDVEWLDWNSLPENQRLGVADYYSKTAKRRGTCALIPRPVF